MKYFIFTFLIFSVFSISSCFRNSTPEEIEEIISRSNSLKRVNKLCLEIPKLRWFQFCSERVRR